MQRATISVSEGRFPEAHFDDRRTMEPTIGYALRRLCAQARMLGTGIHVEVDDRGTRLSLVIDAEGRLRTRPGARARIGTPTVARSDTGERPSRERTAHEKPALDHRRTFTSDGGPSPALPPGSHPAQHPAERGGPEADSAAPERSRDEAGSTREHSNSPVAPEASEPGPQPERRPDAGRRPPSRPGRGGLIAIVALAAVALCGAVLLIT